MPDNTIQKRIEETERELQQLQNRQKILLNRKKNEERRARTRRLIEHGAVLESIYPSAKEMTADELIDFLLSLKPEITEK